MSLSESQMLWLKDQSARRCVLVEVYGISGNEFDFIDDVGDFLIDDVGDNLIGRDGGIKLSVTGYVDAETIYPASIVGGMKFTEELNLEGGEASLSFSDIEVGNSNGQRDNWLDMIWTNRDFSVFIGDVSWPRSEFFPVHNGIIDGIDSKKSNVLNIKVRDKLQRLNTPISEATLGGSSINKDKLLPHLFGECFNVTPLLVDPATQEYQIHNGSMEGYIENRDNGVPVLFSDDISAGKFTLTEKLWGTVTCSAQGDTSTGTYLNTVADLIENIAINYGSIDRRFTANDIDADNFSAFNIANPQPVGLFVGSRLNRLSAIHQLANSVGAHATMSQDGLLRLLKIEFPPVGVPAQITAADMQERNSIKITKRIPIKAAIKVGYCKNWTVQPDLQTGIPDEHGVFYADEWLSKTAVNADVAAAHQLDIEPAQKDTLLVDDIDAGNEAQRLLDIYSVQRTVFEFIGYANLIDLQLGGAANLTHNRYGLGSGKLGVIVKLQKDWFNFSVRVGVMV